MRMAFKEWAVIIDALGRGEQILILRKGGLAEGRGGFQVEHPSFLLFPTRYHQQREGVVPSAQARYDLLLGELPPAEMVRISFQADVVGWWRVTDASVLVRLAGWHVWREEVLAQRFTWGAQESIVALALRVYALARPVDLPMLPAYGGCKSWVELAPELALEGRRPVLDEPAFIAQLAGLRQALGASAEA